MNYSHYSFPITFRSPTPNFTAVSNPNFIPHSIPNHTQPRISFKHQTYYPHSTNVIPTYNRNITNIIPPHSPHYSPHNNIIPPHSPHYSPHNNIIPLHSPHYSPYNNHSSFTHKRSVLPPSHNIGSAFIPYNTHYQNHYPSQIDIPNLPSTLSLPQINIPSQHFPDVNFDQLCNVPIEQTSVFCVICNESYTQKQKEEHLTKHNKSSIKTQNHAFFTALAKLEAAPLPPQSKLILKPIIQPQQYNVQRQSIQWKITDIHRYRTEEKQPKVEWGANTEYNIESNKNKAGIYNTVQQKQIKQSSAVKQNNIQGNKELKSNDQFEHLSKLSVPFGSNMQRVSIPIQIPHDDTILFNIQQANEVKTQDKNVVNGSNEQSDPNSNKKSVVNEKQQRESNTNKQNAQSPNKQQIPFMNILEEVGGQPLNQQPATMLKPVKKRLAKSREY